MRPSPPSTLRIMLAFTLVELLVVLAIISMLASMSLGTLKTVKASADMISCRSNLRQLGFGAVAYSADWDGNVVLSRNTKPAVWYQGGMEQYLAPYLGLTPQDSSFPIPLSMGCKVWPRTDNFQVQKATYGNYNRMDLSTTEYTVDPSTIPVNGQGKMMGPGSTNYDPDWSNLCAETPLAGVTKTSTRPWFMDLSKNRGDWLPWMDMGWWPGNWTLWKPSFERHRGKGNVLFFDLHAAPMTFNECTSGQLQH